MSDARAMLRAARETRRIQHPNASYSSGSLACTVCHTSLKADSLWDSHIRSTQHLSQAKAATKSAPALTNRKRKAEDDTDTYDDNKRSKKDSQEEDTEKATPAPATSAADGREDVSNVLNEQEVDDAEWEAFERDMKQLETKAAQSTAPAGIISGGPKSAAELAAEAREAQSNQKTSRDAENEADRDEAADRAQEEFEEMERLQDRMRILRERREALKNARSAQIEQIHNAAEELDSGQKPASDAEEEEEEDNEESEGSDDEDEDEWQSLSVRR